jgi:hypothetical protein
VPLFRNELLASLHQSILALLVFALVLGGCAVAWADEKSHVSSETLRVRVVWGGGQARRWVGRLTVDRGKLSGLQLIGAEPDTPGSIVLTDEAVEIRQPRPRTLDGFNLTVSDNKAAILRFEVSSDELQDARVVVLPIEKITESPQRVALDDKQNELIVQRIADDLLRVRTDRKALTFAPSEVFAFEVEPAIFPWPSASGLKLKVEVIGEGDRIAAAQQADFPLAAGTNLSFSPVVPSQPGAYTIRIAVEQSNGRSYRLPLMPVSGNEVLAERRFRIVVLDPQPTALPSVSDWPVIFELDPTIATWTQRLPDWVALRRLPSLSRGSLGSPVPSVVSTPSRAWVELQPKQSTSNAEWQGYPLPAASIGKPHVVEIDIPSDFAQQLAVHVIDEGPGGKSIELGRGVIWYRDNPLQVSTALNIETLRYMYWPRTNNATLVIQPAGSGPIRYSQIRVRTAGLHPQPTTTTQESHSSIRSLHIDNPNWWSDIIVVEGSRARDIADLHAALTRLAEWAKLAGFQRVYLPINSSGAWLTSVDHGDSTPRLVRTAVDSGMNDLPECDVLQLALEVFAVYDLELAPVVEFKGTVSDLELQKRQGKATIELLDATGRSWAETYPASMVASRYDVLHPCVQASAVSVIESVLSKHANHAAFGGIAIRLSGDSWAVPAGARWGLHADALEQARRVDTSIDLPSDPHKIIADDRLRQHWLGYRSQLVEVFYRQLDQLVRDRCGKPITFLTHDVFEDIEFGSRLRPPVAMSPDYALWCREHGLPFFAYDSTTKLRESPVDEVVAHRLDFSRSPLSLIHPFSPSQQVKRLQTVVSTRQVDFTGSESARDLSLSGRGKLPVALVAANDGAHRVAARLRLASESSEWISTMPYPATTLRSEISRGALASQALSGISSAAVVQQPVYVRISSAADQSTLQATNVSDWPVDTAVTIDVPRAATAESSLPDDKVSATYSSGRHVWHVKLAAHETHTLTFDSPGVSVEGVRLDIDPQYVKSLEERIRQLEQRDLNASTRIEPLDNLSMERVADRQLPAGWTVAHQGQASCRVDAAVSKEGSHSLFLDSANGGLSIASDFFANPATGQLAVTAYVRAGKVSPDAQLFMIVETESGRYLQHFLFSGQRLAADAGRQEWNGYTLGLEDVPFDPLQRLRIRFELRGTASLHIDGIEIHKLVFPLQLYEESKQQLVAMASMAQLARKRFAEGEYTACESILESYWARFAVSHLPVIKPDDTQRTQESQLGMLPDPPTPRVGSRLRGYLPSFWR